MRISFDFTSLAQLRDQLALFLDSTGGGGSPGGVTAPAEPEESPQETDSEPAPAPAAKRKPGRPRKNPEPAPEPAPKATPAPPAESDAERLNRLRVALQQAIDAVGPGAAREIFVRFGIKRLSDVTADQSPAFIQALAEAQEMAS